MTAGAALWILALVSPAGAQGAKAPPAQAIILKEAVRTDGLPVLIATNHLGLGAEARRLVSWIVAHQGALTLRPLDLTLEASARSIKVSPAMARTLRRLNQWHNLEATAENPITHAQLRKGALSPASVDRIRMIFERAIRRGVRIGSTWLTPETGGEAVLDGELRLVEAPDPRWSIVEDLVKVSHEPASVAALYAARTEEITQVDTHGLLKVAIERLRLGTTGASDEVRRALLTVARNAAPTYSLGPEEQLALVSGFDWQGRYVGAWHTHAPHDANGEWVGGDVPSFEDMQNAVQYGQFLTLSFQPDGFDLYDAEPLADVKRVDLKLLRVIRYRSPSWRAHFETLRKAIR